MSSIPGSRFQYSATSLRSLITMHARRSLYRTNGSLIVKPLVVLAARVLGPGPLRLKLVKLAHELSDGGVVIEATQGGYVASLPVDRAVAQDTQRAA
jgi:hypothetical protein